MDNKDDKKLEWMYKNANSLVDREEYLLGRTVDKTLEQLNAEEKEKKFVLPTPKNHVEHECIPPSIRDFNKIVQSEQVDLSAKLQEDPLVAIKKREEEARRQFLQNPVQLKKLQEALKAQQKKSKKKKHKKPKSSDSDSDIDNKIVEKFKLLKRNTLAVGVPKNTKKSDENNLDTILMHKFNALKDKLSEEDLQDILDGKISSESEDEKPKKVKKRKPSSDSDDQRSSEKNKKKYSRESSSEYDEKIRKNIRKEDKKQVISKKKKNVSYSDDDNDYKKSNKYKKNALESSNRKKYSSTYKRNHHNSSSSDSEDEKEKSRNKEKYVEKTLDSKSQEDSVKDRERKQYINFDEVNKDLKRGERDSMQQKEKHGKNNDEDSELERKIEEKLKQLRQAVEAKQNTIKKILGPEKPSHLEEFHRSTTTSSDSESDSDDDGERKPKLKSFGLVTSSGKKIAFKGETESSKYVKKSTKIESAYKPDRNKVKKLTEEEKEKRRREMMTNAIERDREREETVKKYRETVKREEDEMRSREFNKEFVYQQLRKSTKHTTVEERIKSNLNNIQRSSRHMESNFSKR